MCGACNCSLGIGGRKRKPTNSLYIARSSNLALPSATGFASYRSPMGRFAEIPPGEEAGVYVQGLEQRYLVIEKTSYRPEKESQGWDSKDTVYRHYDRETYSISSLRALLESEGLDSADELDRLLEQAEAKSGVVSGISHQVRTAMGLRDQPVLDQFQGEIFRLPLRSQLIILGPPGTGKTTTLIKRLGQKLDPESLDADEHRVVEQSSRYRPHSTSWLMFTPSELLKHYLKEAFSREQVPASDANIRTWLSFRNDIARNTLGILRSANGGKFTLKPESRVVNRDVVEDSRAWYDEFQTFHERKLRKQLLDGLAIASAAASESDEAVVNQLSALEDKLEKSALVDVYRALDRLEGPVKKALEDTKVVAEKLLKKERNRLFNNNKQFFKDLAEFLDTLQQETEPDDEQDEGAATTRNSIPTAVKAYLASIRALARTRYLKRSLSKTSRSASVIQFLGDAVPTDEVLIEIGRHISFQNGLRRFISSHKRFVADVPSSFQQFRKDKAIAQTFYAEESVNGIQISSIELDAMVLSMISNARHLLTQSFVAQASEEPRFGYLVNIADLFRNQIMVDEATDFSLLELACMANLTALESQSFFAYGDFNQRITTTGIRHHAQLNWISPSLSVRTVQLVYRQSRKLNSFAEELLRLQGGDLSALGKVPEESSHEGVNPVLIEFANAEKGIYWIAERIKEVERLVQQLPTIAVLVNSEQEVKPTADLLTRYLEEINLAAVACEEGKALGEGTDVRVFDIQHIKGLEFEAVFFNGIDQLAQEKPEMFDRFLYVGATRAATYLGLVCREALPARLEGLRSNLIDSWDA